jgi:hypothetical protein
MIAKLQVQKIEERENLGARKKSAKNQGTRKREHKSAKFRAQKRAGKCEREELRQIAQSVKKARAQLWHSPYKSIIIYFYK